MIKRIWIVIRDQNKNHRREEHQHRALPAAKPKWYQMGLPVSQLTQADVTVKIN